MLHSDATRQRRLIQLRTASLAALLTTPTVLGGHFLAAWSTSSVLLAGAVALPASVAGGFALWTKHPPSLEEEPESTIFSRPENYEVVERTGLAKILNDVTFIGLAVVGSTLIFVIGLLLRFVIPWAILGGYALTYEASTRSTLSVAALTLLLLCCFEFGVEHPLLKRWGLPIESKKRPRSDYCPAPDRDSK